jgi:hypothetical protein
MPEQLSNYPVECPSCRKVEGWPKVVRTVKGQMLQLEVELMCKACDHRWRDTVGIRDGLPELRRHGRNPTPRPRRSRDPLAWPSMHKVPSRMGDFRIVPGVDPEDQA